MVFVISMAIRPGMIVCHYSEQGSTIGVISSTGTQGDRLCIKGYNHETYQSPGI